MEFENRTKIPTELETPLMKDVKKLLLENNIEKAIIPRLSEDFQDFSSGMFIGELFSDEIAEFCNNLNLFISDYFLKPEDKLDEDWYYGYHIPQHNVEYILTIEDIVDKESQIKAFNEDFINPKRELIYYNDCYYLSNDKYEDYIKAIEEKD